MIAGRVFSAVRTLIEGRAGERTLVVVFEDLHWADPASLDLIGYLIRSRGWPGAIVATYRSDELHRRHPLVPWLAEIARVPFVERIELRRLDRERRGGPGGRDPGASAGRRPRRRARCVALTATRSSRRSCSRPRAWTGPSRGPPACSSSCSPVSPACRIPRGRPSRRCRSPDHPATRSCSPGCSGSRSATSRRRCEWRSTRRC